jgi:hypothetical protein
MQNMQNGPPTRVRFAAVDMFGRGTANSLILFSSVNA